MTEDLVRDTLHNLSQEAIKLRFMGSFPDSSASPGQILHYLIDSRQRADRVEGIYVKLLSIRGELARRSSAVNAMADEAWVTALTSVKRSTVSVREDSFSAPRERYADADLATLTEKRAARKATELLLVAEESSDIVKTALKGLNDTINDLKVWIRSLQFQSHLEN